MSHGEAASDEGILRFIMKYNLQSGNQSYLHYMHRSQKPACFIHVNVTVLYLVALWALFGTLMLAWLPALRCVLYDTLVVILYRLDFGSNFTLHQFIYEMNKMIGNAPEI